MQKTEHLLMSVAPDTTHTPPPRAAFNPTQSCPWSGRFGRKSALETLAYEEHTAGSVWGRARSHGEGAQARGCPGCSMLRWG